jgi:hypothetical protein
MLQASTARHDIPATTTPHIVCLGSAYKPSIMYVAIEGKLMIRVKTVVDGIAVLLMIYYIFWMEYPVKCRCSYKYLQQTILQRNAVESGPVPAKLVRFFEKLAE